MAVYVDKIKKKLKSGQLRRGNVDKRNDNKIIRDHFKSLLLAKIHHTNVLSALVKACDVRSREVLGTIILPIKAG